MGLFSGMHISKKVLEKEPAAEKNTGDKLMTSANYTQPILWNIVLLLKIHAFLSKRRLPKLQQLSDHTNTMKEKESLYKSLAESKVTDSKKEKFRNKTDV